MGQWLIKSVGVSLPIELALDLFRCAKQGDRAHGGRYESRDATTAVMLLIWPAIGVSRERPAGLQGSAHFHWRTPFDGEVTLYRIGWDPLAGGSEELVWEELETLAGQPIRP